MSMSTFGSRSSPGPVRTAAAGTSGPSPPQNVVGARADECADPGLVATADEYSGGVAEDGSGRVAVRITAAAQAQFPGVLHAELAEHLLVLRMHLVRHAGGRRDQRDPGQAAAAQLDEPFEHP